MNQGDKRSVPNHVVLVQQSLYTNHQPAGEIVPTQLPVASFNRSDHLPKGNGSEVERYCCYDREKDFLVVGEHQDLETVMVQSIG